MRSQSRPHGAEDDQSRQKRLIKASLALVWHELRRYFRHKELATVGDELLADDVDARQWTMLHEHQFQVFGEQAVWGVWSEAEARSLLLAPVPPLSTTAFPLAFLCTIVDKKLAINTSFTGRSS